MRVKDIIPSCRLDLNDNGDTFRYHDSQILEYISEAVNMITRLLSVNPKANKTVLRFKLSAGSRQFIENINSIEYIDAQVKSDGNILVNFPRQYKDMQQPSLSTAPKASVSREEWRISGWALSNTDNSTFYVEPPVPQGGEYYLEVRVVSLFNAGVASETDGFDVSYLPAIRQWVLFRCLSVEINSAPSSSLASSHFEKFWILSKQLLSQNLAVSFNLSDKETSRTINHLRALGLV